jgi:hypothetical protein
MSCAPHLVDLLAPTIDARLNVNLEGIPLAMFNKGNHQPGDPHVDRRNLRV